jgi:hypothetical protein
VQQGAEFIEAVLIKPDTKSFYQTQDQMKIRLLILLGVLLIPGCSAKAFGTVVGGLASLAILLLFLLILALVAIIPYAVAIWVVVHLYQQNTKEENKRVTASNELAEKRQREVELLAKQLAEKRAADAKQRAMELAEEKARIEKRIADAVLRQWEADRLKKQKATPQEEVSQRAEADRLKKQKAAQRAAAARRRERELEAHIAALDDWYRKEALRLHPDRGGSVVEMQKLNAEYDRLRKNVGAQSS